jgi:hypothetical protein
VTLVSDVVARVRRRLLATQREEMNTLAAAYAAGGTSLSFTYDLRSIVRGAQVEVGRELFHVWDSDTSAKTATVLGAQQGTVAASHASGDLAVVNPKVPADSIVLAVNDVLRRLSAAGLFRARTVTFTANATRRGYDLAADVTRTLEVVYAESGPGKAYPEVRKYRIRPVMPSADFPSGKQIVFDEPLEAGRTVTVKYAAPFTPVVNLADDVETASFLPATAVVLLELGAAIDLWAGREVKRNLTEAQGNTRRAEEVPPGAVQASTAGLRQQYRDRLNEELARQALEWGAG